MFADDDLVIMCLRRNNESTPLAANSCIWPCILCKEEVWVCQESLQLILTEKNAKVCCGDCLAPLIRKQKEPIELLGLNSKQTLVPFDEALKDPSPELKETLRGVRNTKPFNDTKH